MVKFSHIADCHLGGWRDPRMRELNSLAFEKAIERSISLQVDFVLICGDLYNTALPAIEVVKDSVRILGKLREAKIPVYIIAGSHDYSPSGKTMLGVLEEAGLVINVAKQKEGEGLCLEFTQDPKTGTKMCGIIGRRGALEQSYYEHLNREELESEEGFKVFLFHSALLELKEKGFEEMLAMPLSYLPKGFDYYAGGHVHVICDKEVDGYRVVYPGPLFPNSFDETEKLKGGGFFVYDNGSVTREEVTLKRVVEVLVKSNSHTSEEVMGLLQAALIGKDFSDSIVTIRCKGILGSGKISDIDFSSFVKQIYEMGAYFVMRNTRGLESQAFEAVRIEEEQIDVLEKNLVKEHAGQDKRLGFDVEKEVSFGLELLGALSSEKNEGETKSTYDDRMKAEARKIVEKYLVK